MYCVELIYAQTVGISLFYKLEMKTIFIKARLKFEKYLKFTPN